MKTEEHIIADSSGNYSRKSTVAYPDTEDELKLCVFLDAEYYLERIDAIPIISELILRNHIPPVACVFISHVNAERRQYDYTCSDEYADFVARDVFDWMKDRFPSLSEKENAICGLSLSGLQAAYTQMIHRERFSYALCQSGSFWWNDEFLSQQVDSSIAGSRYYLSVGSKETDKGISHPPTGLRQEVSQIEAVRRLVKTLSEHDAEVRFETFDGGHEIEPWKHELSEAVSWLIGNQPNKEVLGRIVASKLPFQHQSPTP